MRNSQTTIEAICTRRDILLGISALLMFPQLARAERNVSVDLRLADNLVGFYSAKIHSFLSENLEITPTHKIARPQFHFVRVSDGKLAAMFSSPRAEKVVFPGKMFFPGEMFLPEAPFFEGLKITKVKRGGKLNGLNKETLFQAARTAFGKGSGVMITTSWDDMAPSDASSTLYLYS